VVDATFSTESHRLAFREAAIRKGARFLFVECRAKEDKLRERLRGREKEPGVSDAREGLLDNFASRWEPVRGIPPGEFYALDTSGEPERSWESLEAFLAGPK
jgi:predicted kinase